ncbi:cell division protein FtsX [Azorhizobium oxalatiphilum]|uniref:Cell division protein FtsX n=1 Tax=Azorhizobium oxalatiphilum TaxID=980631 RepID=A0A917C8V0_9HYPH|nr:ABC transporter permease [Azorhizobium oxalatiphilum]GGF76254.1 cell division protein FtsX [Azorhizobium oxalatiphilum]
MSTTDDTTVPAPPPATPGKPEKPAKPKAVPVTPIVPGATVAGRALIAVVAIMTFLAALTIGSVMAVRSTAGAWRSDVTREVTIQIRAGDKAVTDAQVRAAVDLAQQTPGILEAHVLTETETGRLLEPWLGAGLDYSDLPVPRIVVLRLDPAASPDLARLRRTLTDRIPTAALDDHRTWSRRLGAMAEGVMITGFGLLALVGVATVLSVVFATRAAVATNRTIVEVLHFVGARDGFIAAQFQRHFLKIGMQGGILGGVAAAALFGGLMSLPRFGILADPENPGIITWLDPGWLGFGGIAIAVIIIALVTALTSRITVYRTLRTIA